MAKTILFSVVVFIILDFTYYEYLKRIKKINYKNYFEYVEKEIKK